MKTLSVLLTCILFVILVSSCQNRVKDANDALLLADSYMTSRPATSLRILDSLNNTTVEKDHYFALLYAQAKYRNYVKAENDSFIRTALDYYSTSSDFAMKTRAYLVAAQIYYELGDNGVALNFIHKSSDAASEITDNWIKSAIYYM